MNKKIAILEGDGIGPEVIREAVKTLDAVARVYHHTFSYEKGLVGATAIDATGDAILFGAIGDPKYDNDPSAKVRPEQGLLRMRSSLGLYANIRPVTSYPALADHSPLKNEIINGTDFVVFRELTGGIYFGEPRGRSENDQVSFDTCVYARHEIRRIAHLAFQAAQKRRGHVTLVDKANVLATSRLWREEVKALAGEYPDVTLDFMFVDNAAMKIILQPSFFDVVLTENMFGDILTDEASVIAGSLGLLPSASMGDTFALFEPIHGSYPQAAGKNIANPMGAILSAAMMLEYAFDAIEEGRAIREAVSDTLDEGYMTEDLDPSGARKTSEIGDIIAAKVLAMKEIAE